MTNWSREYYARLFGVAGHPFNKAIDCALRDCDVEVRVGWPRQQGPYTVTVRHGEAFSGELVEDTYRESFALDELIAEWVAREHEFACICDDGGVVWCPAHGDLWYDQDGYQYRVERDGRPAPGRARTVAELVDSGVFV